ncbi:4Fe-4S ferredoxin [Synergistales bacterium]|nr:4Fe-4S ferredoxin [Synergistales bacterium]
MGGRIYKGPLKGVCVPGLNCYSCPGALFSCPLGSLQAILAGWEYSFSFYVTGLLLGFGAIFGRFICGFLCPFGLIQELLHKIPLFKNKRAIKIPKFFLYIKYVILAVFVVALPVFAKGEFGVGYPAFCKFLCPAGTIEAGLPLLAGSEGLRKAAGALFLWKALLSAAVVVGCVVIYRFFCRVLCPLGAFYSFFNKISLLRIDPDEVRGTFCKMGLNPVLEVNSLECIRCGECKAHAKRRFAGRGSSAEVMANTTEQIIHSA